MRKVLITGANSYIGMSFEKYVLEHHSSELTIETIDMIDGSWKTKDFSVYDVVFHVAGIAHVDVGNVIDEDKSKYFAVNTSLAIDTCKKAKADGVKQFVFMSSASIYGDSSPCGKRKHITKDTEPVPTTLYGESKLLADQGVRALEDASFTVTVLRPPMIYGKGCKGNYPSLAKLAKKLIIFPRIENERSMLYIDNLCEFLSIIMINCKGGVYWPQNSEFTRTSDMVKYIAKINNHKIFVSKIWNWVVGLARIIPGKTRKLANKAFGNFTYDQSMSKYDFDYIVADLNTSIERTEG